MDAVEADQPPFDALGNRQQILDPLAGQFNFQRRSARAALMASLTPDVPKSRAPVLAAVFSA